MTKYYIEIAKEARPETGSVGWADVRPATDEEIEKFQSKFCDHSQTELLIYDSSGFAFDIRHCGVCGSVLGFI